MAKQPSNPKSALREWVESILIALVLAIFIRTYFFQPFKIPSGSMRMTLIEGDHLFVNKLRYGPIVLPEIHAPDFMRQWFGQDFDLKNIFQPQYENWLIVVLSLNYKLLP
jgi:signal peptidase I